MPPSDGPSNPGDDDPPENLPGQGDARNPALRPGLQLLDLTLPTLSENLALDEALLLAAEDGSGPPTLRFWELDHPAVVLGASGRMAEDVKVEACRADGVVIGRRSSGGGTVVIGPGALNFAVILPVAWAPQLKAVDTAQNYVLERTAGAIRREGPDARVLGSGDLTLDRRKFSGSAQRRLRHHLLVHASLLYDFPLDRIDRYTRVPGRKPDYREGRSHADFVVNLPLNADRLRAAIRSAWLPGGRSPGPPGVPEGLVRDLVAGKFSDIGWIERL